MLPSRPRLEGWNPSSLSQTGPAIGTAGHSVEEAVDRIDHNLKIMPETKAWSGSAHDAATQMFDRAHKQTQSFSDYAAAVGKALADGAGPIADARNALLGKADEIDRDPNLHITDQWVVLIKPAALTAEQMNALNQRVVTEQAAVNQLLAAVGRADESTASNVAAAAQRFGFTAPAGLGGLMVPGAQRPADEVPNPSAAPGIYQQNLIRGEDMSITVRDTTQSYDKDGHYVKTLTMQDGSKHVITEYHYDYAHGVPEMTTDEYWAPNGNWISKTSTTKTPNGTTQTIINWADGTQFVGSETPDGQRSAAFTLPDGRHGVLPPDNPFFTGPVPTVVGGAATGLEDYVGRGGQIPGLSIDAVENVGKGARYAGPAVGVPTTIYSMGAAPTLHDACVAGIAGTFGIAGDYVGGSIGGTLGGAVPIIDLATGPGGAMIGAYYGGDLMKSLGTKVGEAFCS
jgi:hypothetical protein